MMHTSEIKDPSCDQQEGLDIVSPLTLDQAHIFIQLLSSEVADMLEKHTEDELAEVTDDLYQMLVTIVQKYDEFLLAHSVVNYATGSSLVSTGSGNRLRKRSDGRIEFYAEEAISDETP